MPAGAGNHSAASCRMWTLGCGRGGRPSSGQHLNPDPGGVARWRRRAGGHRDQQTDWQARPTPGRESDESLWRRCPHSPWCARILAETDVRRMPLLRSTRSLSAWVRAMLTASLHYFSTKARNSKGEFPPCNGGDFRLDAVRPRRSTQHMKLGSFSSRLGGRGVETSSWRGVRGTAPAIVGKPSTKVRGVTRACGLY